MSRRKHKPHVKRRAVKAITSSVPGALQPFRPGTEQDHAALLAAVASALQAAERAGVCPRLKHDAVLSEAGYVLKVGGRWVSRTRMLTEFPAGQGGSDEGG